MERGKDQADHLLQLSVGSIVDSRNQEVRRGLSRYFRTHGLYFHPCVVQHPVYSIANTRLACFASFRASIASKALLPRFALPTGKGRLYAGFQEHHKDVMKSKKMESVDKEDEYCPQVLVALISSVDTDLTLTKATRVVMFEPLSKFTDEEQAISVGQNKAVKVWKFSCAGKRGVGYERVVKKLNSARNMFVEDGSLWQAKDDEAGQVGDQVMAEVGEDPS